MSEYNLELVEDIERFIKEQLKDVPNSNYLIVEKSWRPTLQIRGDKTWTSLFRQPFLLIFTSSKLFLYQYLHNDSMALSTINYETIKVFEVEKLTPFNEYCISFISDKKYYFYLDSGEAFLDYFDTTEDFSLANLKYLLAKNFYGLIN